MQQDEIVVRSFWSPVGDMIAGATEQGVCLLEWHSRGGVECVKERVEKRFQRCVVEGNHDYLQALERNLGDYFDGALKQFNVPLHLEGTPFEREVWAQLLAIPYAETHTYGQVAAAVGKPQACRAVGRANGANCVSIVVPCHRVIESSGKLRGYGGGLWRKKFLLDLEQKHRPVPSSAPTLVSAS
jgi:AraC family transcriptional regulator of adaptative response/methylated-DNA-[protein]-cysteine methyltransferase